MKNGTSIRTMADVQALLKRFGAVLYTGDRLGDLHLMEEELAELHQLGLLETDSWLAARLVIQQEKRRVSSESDSIR
ncbi:YqgQ family protein [Desmospora profundinema]|uniref:Uncharacterized protein YqgQ n=1 Tax=Desmospora profundinema TaxID=1571184 RepID=A0ABU1IRH6_9BACL|nr:YqgQ family protein [Desmospora profundinema]MDR6227401.1 uncharacterized protein YqgQ [Desmospora profundinema]